MSQCSPVIRKIRTDCADDFSVFERCLRENQSSSETCQPHITRFLACAETVDISGLGEQWSRCASWIMFKIRFKNIWINKHDSLNSNKVIWIYDWECKHESRDLKTVFFQQQTVRLSPRRCLPFVTASSNEDKTQVFLYFNTGGKWVMEMFIIFEELQHRETRTNRPQYFARFLSSFLKFSF